MQMVALVLAVALGVVVAGMRLLHRPRSTGGQPEAREDGVASSLVEESIELEVLYDEAVAEDDVPTEEQIRWLDEALAAQREYARVAGLPAEETRDREAALERKLARAQALRARERSRDLERLASDQLSLGDRERALASLHDALRLQEWIDSQDSAVGMRDLERQEELRLRIDAVEVRPMVDELDRLEMAGQAAALGNRTAEAEALYLQAAGLLATIIREHPLSPFADRQRLERIESERVSLGATILIRQRDEAVVEAIRRREAGLRADAARLYEHAAGLQRQINATYPASRYASEALVEQLEMARLEALGGSPGVSGR
jgi:hypothetical protein